MKITTAPFGTYDDGRNARLITIDTGYGAASFTDFGASLAALRVPDRNGELDDVVLGLCSGGEYQRHGWSMGAVCGRFANRLAGSRFTLNSQEHLLDKNHPLYTLHGGSAGFNSRIWQPEQDGEGIVFSLVSEDGDQGFPGNMEVRVRYGFSETGVLSMDFYARSDRDTPISLTNHAYFNLSGHASGDAHQLLRVNGDFFNPQAEGQLPTGEVRLVEGTVMDFRKERDVAEAHAAHDEQIAIAGGLDHNFLLNKTERGALEFAGSLRSSGTGRRMDVYTTMPALMVFTANSLDLIGKDGAHYRDRGAVCMECQNVPDSMRHTHFPSPVLKAGEEYTARTEYRFFVDELGL